jgi:hypothetical protein
LNDVASSLSALLAERQRRIAARLAEEEKARLEAEAEKARAAANVGRLADLCAELRERYHPKQRAFFDRTATKRDPLWQGAALCTRRAGKTAGGTRETLARCLESPGHRIVYCGATRAEAKARAWKGDTGDGWNNLLQQHGKRIPKSKPAAYEIAGLTATVDGQELSIDFSNGSQLLIFAADHPDDQDKLRGRAKHVVWIDEAQDFRDLTTFVDGVVSPLVMDFKGEIWITGTPSRDAAGYFYEVTTDPESGDEPRPGWDVHRWDVTDNPFFGATAQERWDRTAGAALAKNRWKGDEPDFLREWRGKWVKTDAFFTYAVNAVPEHQLHWKTPSGELAPMRLDDDGWLDYEAAMDDLPRKPNGSRYKWLVGIGVDFGMEHPMAIVAWSFCLELPGIWELFSWKKPGLVPDDQRDAIWRIVRQVENLMVLVGDPGGQKKGDLIAWKERSLLPIEPSDKAHKATWQKMLNGDIRTGLARFRKGSPMLYEMKHLMNKRGPTGKSVELDERTLPSGEKPGNDACDAGLYGFRHIHHFLGKPTEDTPTPGSPQALEREAAKHADQLEDLAKQRAAEMSYGDEWSF